MKIGIISHSYPTRSRAHFGTFIKDHIDLIKNDAEITLYLLTPRTIPFTQRFMEHHEQFAEPYISRIRYVSIPTMRLPRITQRNVSNALIRHIDPDTDLLHLHFLYPAALAVPALHAKGFRCVATSHGSDFYKSIKKPPVKRILTASISKLERIFAVGHQLKTDIENVWPGASEKTFVTHNTVDSELFTLPESKSAIKKSLQWDTDCTHVLFVGNIREEKGPDVLLDALDHIPAEANIHVHMIGTFYNDGFADAIKAKQNRHKSLITSYPATTRDQLKSFYQAADVFVSPSRSESFGMALAEAAACGTPVLATKSGGPQEIVTENVGMLVDSESPKALADGMLKMITELKDYSPAAIRNEITSRFSKSQARETLLKHYQNVIG